MRTNIKTIQTNEKSIAKSEVYLSLATQLEGVPPDPGGTPRSTLGLGVTMTFAKTTRTLSSGCETTHFTMLVNRVDYPVDLGITTDCLKVIKLVENCMCTVDGYCKLNGDIRYTGR